MGAAALAEATFANLQVSQRMPTGMRTGEEHREASPPEGPQSPQNQGAGEEAAAVVPWHRRDANTNSLFTHQHDGGEVARMSIEPGSSSIEFLRQQSSEKLKRAWESIYRKFENAHLEVQDEIYLGRRKVKGDRMRMIRDRGHLRSLHKTASLGFGCFHIDKAELIGCKAERDSSDGPIKQEEEENADEKAQHSAQRQGFRATERAGWSKEDPDLLAFLQAEARRKQDCGCSESEEEGDVFDADNVVDFSRPEWDTTRAQKRKCSESSHGNGLEVYSLALAEWSEEEDEAGAGKEGRASKTTAETRSSPLDPRPRSLRAAATLATPPAARSSSWTTPLEQSTSRDGQSGSRKRKRERIVLPNPEQSPHSLQSPSGCQGVGKCSKSLCMLCGGFQRALRQST